MMNLSSVGRVALPLGLMTLSLHLHAREDEHPNVIFILADDYGWNDLSCMGSQYYETPNLDRLAKHGVRIYECLCRVSGINPSRASIMTGKYTPRHGVTDWIGEKSGEDWRSMKRHSKLLPADYAWSLPADEYTLAECLRDNGYTTFIAGKWHLGDEGSWRGSDFEISQERLDSRYPLLAVILLAYKNPKLKDGPAGENLSMRLGNETVIFLCARIRKKIKENRFCFPFFLCCSWPRFRRPRKTGLFREKAEQLE